VLAIIAVAVIGAVAYTLRPRETPAPAPKLERSDPTAVAEVHGGKALRLKGKDQDLVVDYRVQTTNKDGETSLRDVKIAVNNRAGRNYIVTGQQAFIGKESTSFDVRGDVKMETDDGLVATSQQATYTDAERMVRIPGEVRFSQGRMTGSGIGFTFDEQRDVMWILDKADVKFTAKDNLGPMAFTAGVFGYARRDRYMRFEKTMHMERDAQVVDADNAMVRLFADRDEPDYVELRNGASVTGSGADSALKVMSARDINLDYMDDGRTLQNATLAGKAEIDVASKGASGTQQLAGDYMDIGLEPDGSLRHLSARDGVVVTLPATKDTAARTIKSKSLTAAGNAQGIREMKFSEGVDYREPGAKGQSGKTVRAQSLEAGLDAASGTLQTARFAGNVDFTDSPLHATSAEVRYDVAAGTLALLGQSPSPHIDSDTVTIDAVTIDVTLNPRTMTAKGNVRSTLLPPKKPAPGAAETKRPALLTDTDPVSIISESLTYDEAARKADYADFKGKTILLQGQTTIHSNTLTLDEAKGDLTAKGKVITNLTIANKEETAGAKLKPMLARAETFTYSDQTRTATYTTTAQLDGEQGNLTAGKLELKLAKEENTLEHLEATGAVTAVVDKRTVTGTRLTYSPKDDQYIAFGVPVKMVDADCQETSGKKLTFWKASDRVQVDGNNEVRTQTKGGGKCTAAPPK
jgi:lipopolysaccharide export system protein LptA